MITQRTPLQKLENQTEEFVFNDKIAFVIGADDNVENPAPKSSTTKRAGLKSTAVVTKKPTPQNTRSRTGTMISKTTANSTTKSATGTTRAGIARPPSRTATQRVTSTRTNTSVLNSSRMNTTQTTSRPATSSPAPNPQQALQSKLMGELQTLQAENLQLKSRVDELRQEAEKYKFENDWTAKQLQMKSDMVDTYSRDLIELRFKAEQLKLLQAQFETTQTQLMKAQTELRTKELEVYGMREQLRSLEKENLDLKVNIKTQQGQIMQMQEDHATAMASTRTKFETELRNQRDGYEIQLQDLRHSHSNEMRNTKNELNREISRLKDLSERTKTDLEYSEEQSNQKSDKISLLEKELSNARATVSDLESKRRADENVRRKLHNMIQELKGNIRVYCRVRPLSDSETQEQKSIDFLKFTTVEENPNRGIEVASETKGMNSEQSVLKFQFDHVFQPTCTQEDVFVEISQLTQSAVDGYKVCIFAYGQTGSGKTFTMEGPEKHKLTPATRGMIPRSVEQVFETAREMKEQGWSYKVEASFLEIYNETLRDLLVPESQQSKNISLDIKHDNSGNTCVTNLTYVTVNRPDQVYELLRIASKNRKVASTQCNERSSRSHSVFTLKISGVNEASQQTTHGVLNLIDLAGSERLNNSKSAGERLKETQHINASLACLGDVIFHLGKKSKHVPFRNSKLTFLLQNCLGGDSKTLMFVNVSPLQANVSETLCSLRFAAKVNACEIGTARRKIENKTPEGNSSLLNSSSVNTSVVSTSSKK